MRTHAAIAALVALGLASTAAMGRQNPRTSEGPEVSVEVVAVDGRNNPVADMKPDEFEVWVGTYRVPIRSVTWVTGTTRERPGRLIVLLLDDLTLDPTLVSRTRDAAKHFVDRIQPGDRMGVAMLNGGAMELTNEPARLRSQIDRFRQSLGVTPVDRLGQQLLARITGIAQGIIEAPEGRRIFVAIGSSWLLNTPVPPAAISGAMNLREEWFAATRALALAHAPYYVIDPRGVGASRNIGIVGLATETGGYAFVNTNDLTGAADKILREADNYYVLRISDPPIGRNAMMRELDVRTSRRGVTLRARKGIPGSL